MLDLVNQMNNMTNMINQMKNRIQMQDNHIQMLDTTNKNYQIQMNKVLTENQNTKIYHNISNVFEVIGMLNKGNGFPVLDKYPIIFEFDRILLDQS